MVELHHLAMFEAVRQTGHVVVLDWAMFEAVRQTGHVVVLD